MGRQVIDLSSPNTQSDTSTVCFNAETVLDLRDRCGRHRRVDHVRMLVHQQPR